MEKPYYVHLLPGVGGALEVSGSGYGEAPSTGHAERFETAAARDIAFPELAAVISQAAIDVEKDKIDRPFGYTLAQSRSSKYTESLFYFLFKNHLNIELGADDLPSLAREAQRKGDSVSARAQVCYDKHIETLDAEVERVDKKSKL